MSKINRLDSSSQGEDSDTKDCTRQMQILSQLIDSELEKSDDEMDGDLLAEYQQMLTDLMQARTPCSESDLDAKLEEVKRQIFLTATCTIQNRKKVSGKRPYRITLRVASIFAAILIALFATLTVAAKVQGYCSTWEFITENIRKIRGLSPGESVNENDVTLIKPTGTATYHSMEELIEAEHLPVLYPTDLPDGVRLRQIRQIDEGDGKMLVLYIFSDASINMNFTNYYQANDNILESEKVLVHGINFYISFKEEKHVYHAVGQYEGLEYNIQCPNYEQLLLFLEKMKGF